MLKLKRVYDPVARDDGTRFLVERLWPRGLSKRKLHVDAWLKDVGPTTALRQWFGHDPRSGRGSEHDTLANSTRGGVVATDPRSRQRSPRDARIQLA